MKRGAQLCAELDDVPAVGLLLEVLGRATSGGGFLPPAHYRDVAWGALLEITDPYARRRVEDELKSNKDSALVRQ